MTPTRTGQAVRATWESSNRLISDISAMPHYKIGAELRRVQQSTKRLLGVGTSKSSKDDESMDKTSLWDRIRNKVLLPGRSRDRVQSAVAASLAASRLCAETVHVAPKASPPAPAKTGRKKKRGTTNIKV